MIEIVQRRDPQSGKVRTTEAELNKKGVVRVLPKNDDIRRVMRHGVTRVGFPSSGGSVEWPNDTFTKRRIKDGDVTIEEAAPRNGASGPSGASGATGRSGTMRRSSRPSTTKRTTHRPDVMSRHSHLMESCHACKF